MQKKSWWRKNWGLILIIILAVLVRIPLLSGSFWLDEAAQALESARPWQLQSQIVDDFQPPLLHYLLHLVMNFGQSEWWLRLWGAFIPGILTVIATYLLGKKLFNRKVAVVGSLLVATSSFQVFFSQELRPYALAGAWGVWSWIFCLEMIGIGNDTFRVKRNSWWDRWLRRLPFGRNFWFWVISTVIGLYSSYLYPFVFLTQLIYLLTQKKFKQFLTGAILAGLAFLPWLSNFWQQLQAGQALRSAMPGWDGVVSFGWIRSLTLTAGKFIFGLSDLEPNFWYLSATILLLVFIVVNAIRYGKSLWQHKKTELIALFVAGVLPLLLALIVSIWVPVVQPKRVLFLQPLMYLVLAVLIFGWSKEKTNWRWSWFKNKENFIGTGLLIVLLTINITSLINYWTQPALQREDWRSLRQEIYQTINPERTLAVFAYQEAFSPWRWYEQQALNNHEINQPLPTFVTGNYYLPAQPESLNQLAYINQNYETVLVWDYLRDLTDPTHLIDQKLVELGWQQVGVYDYPQIGFVRIFQPINSPQLYQPPADQANYELINQTQSLEINQL